ncbi:MAG: FAD-dependent oxidoreductase, partial [Opitutales bacterium]
MKRSHRHDVVVVGAGLAGICAAVTAAREGAFVALIEARGQLGGRIGPQERAQLMGANRCNFAYSRETGLIDEIMLERLRIDVVGSYETWDRLLRNLVKQESRLELFEGVSITAATKNERGDRVEHVTGNEAQGRSFEKFRGRVFVDCTGQANLARLASASRLSAEPTSEDADINSVRRLVTHLQAKDVGTEVLFQQPDWVRIDWNQNEVAPKLAVAESFLDNPDQVLTMEWAGEIPERQPFDAREIAYAAWHFIKNEPNLKERSSNYELAWTSSILSSYPAPRIEGAHVLSVDDIKGQTPFCDAIASGGAGFAGNGTFSTSPLEQVEQPGPFAIPLSSLYAKNVKNLFFAGGHASASSDAAFTLQAPLTAALLGEAVGVTAAKSALSRRIPSSLVEKSESTALRVSLLRRNHDVWA